MSSTIEYTVSIRITLPEAIREVIKKEKDWFVAEYGSSYKSEPHITLYLGRYTLEGFPKLLEDLRGLALKPFTFALLKANMIVEEGLRRNLYVVDVSNREQLQELYESISPVATRYQSPLLREKDRKRLEQGLQKDNMFNPHITLGEVGLDKAQPELTVIQKDLGQIEGAQIPVSSIVVFFHGKEAGDEKAKLIEEVTIPFQS